MTYVKICGLRRPEDIEYANRVQPDFAGFILAEGSHRTVTPERLEELVAGKRDRRPQSGAGEGTRSDVMSGEQSDAAKDLNAKKFCSGIRPAVGEDVGENRQGRILSPQIRTVAVFRNQNISWVSEVSKSPFIDMIQLHGSETGIDIHRLKEETGKPVIKAFRIDTAEDVRRAVESPADYILLDHGAGGTGESFDWSYLTDIDRPYFLAGGLGPENVREAIRRVRPWGVDVSSGVETGKVKDPEKMMKFVKEVRSAEL